MPHAEPITYVHSTAEKSMNAAQIVRSVVFTGSISP